MRRVDIDKYTPIPSDIKEKHDIYIYLWLKEPGAEKGPNFPFKIPDTLIIKEAVITDWYFSSKESNFIFFYTNSYKYY